MNTRGDWKCGSGNIGTKVKENAGVENAGVVAMERQSNTKDSSTTRSQSGVFTNVATFVKYIIVIIW